MRERDHSQPRGDTPWRAGRRLLQGAPERSREHVPEHQRRVPERGEARGGVQARRRRPGAGKSRVLAEVQSRRVRGRRQDGKDPATGRGADDPRAGVPILRIVPRR